MPWRYQISIAKYLKSYSDDLPGNLVKIIYDPKKQKVHFQLTYDAQKRRCLNLQLLEDGRKG